MTDTVSDLQALAARVEKLEAENRRWKLASALSLLSGVLLVLMGAKPVDRVEPPVIRASTVEAQDFVLKDEGGRMRARLSLNPGGKEVEIKGRVYRLLSPQTIPGQAALQFYDDKGDIVWTVPANPTLVPVK